MPVQRRCVQLAVRAAGCMRSWRCAQLAVCAAGGVHQAVQLVVCAAGATAPLPCSDERGNRAWKVRWGRGGGLRVSLATFVYTVWDIKPVLHYL